MARRSLVLLDARTRRTLDVVLTVVLLVVATIAGLAFTLSGHFIGALADPCGGAVRCDYGRIDAGFELGTIGPAAATVLGIAFAIVQLVRRRLAFWIPLAAAALAFALLTAGAGVAGSGVPHH